VALANDNGKTAGHDISWPYDDHGHDNKEHPHPLPSKRERQNKGMRSTRV
jgi:hypothetical protein